MEEYEIKSDQSDHGGWDPYRFLKLDIWWLKMASLLEKRRYLKFKTVKKQAPLVMVVESRGEGFVNISKIWFQIIENI